MRLTSVVLPAPRNPVTMMTDALFERTMSCMGKAAVLSVPSVVLRASYRHLRDVPQPVPTAAHHFALPATADHGRAGVCARAAPHPGHGPRARAQPMGSVADRGLHLADDVADRLAILHLHVAANNRVDRDSLHLPAAPRGRLVLAVELVRVDRHFLLHFDQAHVV